MSAFGLTVRHGPPSPNLNYLLRATQLCLHNGTTFSEQSWVCSPRSWQSKAWDIRPLGSDHFWRCRSLSQRQYGAGFSDTIPAFRNFHRRRRGSLCPARPPLLSGRV